jgi:pyrroline-5-carboxylate reductase
MSNRYDVLIIGVGNMGEALLNAMLKAGLSADRIVLSDTRPERMEELSRIYGCSNNEAEKVVAEVDNIFLVVKPLDLYVLLSKIGPSISSQQRIISFAAGKKTSSIEKFINKGVPVLRVMPNTPMSVGVGASAISKGKYATDEDVKAVQELLKASGKTIVVDESLQDAVTATSGSGPAYFFKFVEAMIAGAQDLGLSEADARTLVIQTITGAAAMLNQDGADPGVLRQNVTSPNGTTYAALQVFEGGDLEGLVKRAMRAARDRSQELS